MKEKQKVERVKECSWSLRPHRLERKLASLSALIGPDGVFKKGLKAAVQTALYKTAPAH